METLFSKACDPCIDRFIGPALVEVHRVLQGVDRCGGCGQTTRLAVFSYLYPYEESYPLDEEA